MRVTVDAYPDGVVMVGLCLPRDLTPQETEVLRAQITGCAQRLLGPPPESDLQRARRLFG